MQTNYLSSMAATSSTTSSTSILNQNNQLGNLSNSITSTPSLHNLHHSSHLQQQHHETVSTTTSTSLGLEPSINIIPINTPLPSVSTIQPNNNANTLILSAVNTSSNTSPTTAYFQNHTNHRSNSVNNTNSRIITLTTNDNNSCEIVPLIVHQHDDQNQRRSISTSTLNNNTTIIFQQKHDDRNNIHQQHSQQQQQQLQQIQSNHSQNLLNDTGNALVDSSTSVLENNLISSPSHPTQSTSRNTTTTCTANNNIKILELDNDTLSSILIRRATIEHFQLQQQNHQQNQQQHQFTTMQSLNESNNIIRVTTACNTDDSDITGTNTNNLNNNNSNSNHTNNNSNNTNKPNSNDLLCNSDIMSATSINNSNNNNSNNNNNNNTNNSNQQQQNINQQIMIDKNCANSSNSNNNSNLSLCDSFTNITDLSNQNNSTIPISSSSITIHNIIQQQQQQQQQEQQQQHQQQNLVIESNIISPALQNQQQQQSQPTMVTKSTNVDMSSIVETSSNSKILRNNDASSSAISTINQSCNDNSLIRSMSSADSLSSDSPLDDFDKHMEDLDGYQDNTSSNSQHSAGGGSSINGGSGSNGIPGGGGGGNGPGNNTNNNLSGSGQQNILGNGNNNNNNNNTGSTGYNSLLPPPVVNSIGGAIGISVGVGPGGHNGNTISSGNVGGGVSGNGNHGHGTGAGHHHGHGHGGSSSHGNITNDPLDFKYLFEELCPVCGDKVSGYHYGLLTCESCKGFFKRTVQNKKVYTCVAERSCHIDKTQRKRCPYCRFQKCLEVGMKLEAVRADRMRGGRNKFGPMYKRDRARKLQMMRQRQLALQAIRSSMGTTDLKPGQISPSAYTQSYPSMSIKQEIQIPQVSSLTQSPDSSPSPIAIALGQVNPSAIIATSLSGNGGGNGSTTTTTISGTNSGGTSSASCGQDSSSGSLQHSSESKICFDSGTNPSSTADSAVEPLRVSPMIREFVQSIDDREWQTQLFALLQKQSYNQVEVDLFELMCKVLDQNLFSQVDWARNTIFFKDLKVDDQMKLLQHSWSDMLVLDHLHQRIHNGLPDETQLNNGQVFNLLGLGLLGVPQLADYFNELQNKLTELKFDMGDYVCMKFLILLNPNVRGIVNKRTVLEGHENVQAALLDYTLTCYPTVTDKFSRLLSILPEIHAMATRGEEHLYAKHCAGSAPTQTLLMEMLHAKRKI